MLEVIVDQLLEKLELTRANLLYTGGGHAYLLVSNTDKVKEKINQFNTELKIGLYQNLQQISHYQLLLKNVVVMT